MSPDLPSQPGPAVSTHAGPSRAVWWLIAVSLAVIAVCMVLRVDGLVVPQAAAQVQAGGGARGVFAFPAQMTKTTYGVFMVDVDTGTIWCYEFTGGRKLRLAAARSWRFDRYLEDHNGEDISPTAVEKLVEQQRQQQKQQQTPGSSP